MKKNIDSAVEDAHNVYLDIVQLVRKKTNLPFGDTKESSIGREWGYYSIEEFLEFKSIAGYFN
jgi:acyl-CoA reductase-like NAD-dependent aldehyde dehydrogenase